MGSEESLESLKARLYRPSAANEAGGDEGEKQNSPQWDLARRAFKNDDRDASAVLLEAARSAEDPEVQAAALEGLGLLGKRAKPALTVVVAGLKSGHRDVREAAARTLHHMRSAAAEAVPSLESAIDDPDETVHGLVVCALREITGDEKRYEMRPKDGGGGRHTWLGAVPFDDPIYKDPTWTVIPVALGHRMNPVYFETKFRVGEPIADWPAEFVVVSAYATTGETWPQHENIAADQALEDELRDMDLWMGRVVGYSPESGHAEPSWAVAMSLEPGCDLGAKYGQDAIYYVAKGQLGVSYCDSRRGVVSFASWAERLDDPGPSKPLQ